MGRYREITETKYPYWERNYMTNTIVIGENLLIDMYLYQVDNVTPLLLTSLILATVQLKQGGVVKATYTYGTNNELRQGDATNALRFELTPTISASLSPGELKVIFYIEVSDARFIVSGGKKCEPIPPLTYKMVQCA